MISRPQITILFGIIIISSIIIFTTSEKKDTPFTRETHNLLPVHTTETYALSSNQQIKLQATPVAGSLNNNLIRLYSFNTQIPGPLLKVTQGDTITVESINIEHAGQTAANIESATKIKGRDRHVFQDGCYITSKPNPHKWT